MREFPTPDALADATEDQILKAWEGLGYYSRVRNLQTAVREVVAEYGGTVPDTREEISTLKGVGPYTAGAILSIAYGKPEPAVDGNVMRVLSRILLIEEDIAKPATRKIFERILYDLISKEDPSSFNQGLMELGALDLYTNLSWLLTLPCKRTLQSKSCRHSRYITDKIKKEKTSTEANGGCYHPK